MKGIIIYKSKYGATGQYAEWIGKDLGIPVFETDALDLDQLKHSDFVILGSSVYIGKLLISKWLQKNLNSLSSKRIFLFIVCGTPDYKKAQLNSYVTASVPEEIRNKCRIYFLPGRLIRKRLSWVDRVMIRMGAWLAKDPAVKSEMRREYDDVKKENIGPLVNTVNETFMAKPEV
jgi:menaquinone-dependent protoporphyrinogen IX oxidase